MVPVPVQLAVSTPSCAGRVGNSEGQWGREGSWAGTGWAGGDCTQSRTLRGHQGETGRGEQAGDTK